MIGADADMSFCFKDCLGCPPCCPVLPEAFFLFIIVPYLDHYLPYLPTTLPTTYLPYLSLTVVQLQINNQTPPRPPPAIPIPIPPPLTFSLPCLLHTLSLSSRTGISPHITAYNKTTPHLSTLSPTYPHTHTQCSQCCCTTDQYRPRYPNVGPEQVSRANPFSLPWPFPHATTAERERRKKKKQKEKTKRIRRLISYRVLPICRLRSLVGPPVTRDVRQGQIY